MVYYLNQTPTILIKHVLLAEAQSQIQHSTFGWFIDHYAMSCQSAPLARYQKRFWQEPEPEAAAGEDICPQVIAI